MELQERLLYITLTIITLQQWTRGDMKQLPTNITCHIQVEETIEDKICLESTNDDIFRQTTAETLTPLNEFAQETSTYDNIFRETTAETPTQLDEVAMVTSTFNDMFRATTAETKPPLGEVAPVSPVSSTYGDMYRETTTEMKPPLGEVALVTSTYDDTYRETKAETKPPLGEVAPVTSTYDNTYRETTTEMKPPLGEVAPVTSTYDDINRETVAETKPPLGEVGPVTTSYDDTYRETTTEIKPPLGEVGPETSTNDDMYRETTTEMKPPLGEVALVTSTYDDTYRETKAETKPPLGEVGPVTSTYDNTYRETTTEMKPPLGEVAPVTSTYDDINKETVAETKPPLGEVGPVTTSYDDTYRETTTEMKPRLGEVGPETSTYDDTYRETTTEMKPPLDKVGQVTSTYDDIYRDTIAETKSPLDKVGPVTSTYDDTYKETIAETKPPLGEVAPVTSTYDDLYRDTIAETKSPLDKVGPVTSTYDDMYRETNTGMKPRLDKVAPVTSTYDDILIETTSETMTPFTEVPQAISTFDGIFRKTTAAVKSPLSESVQNVQSIPSNKIQGSGPVFVQELYRASLLETSNINSVVLKVKAKDKTPVKYTLLGQNNDYFHMNPLNGVIVLAKPLEFNTKNKYTLTAKATDIKGHSSTVPVHIDIKDVDTMNPHFIYPLYEASISENKKGILSTQPQEIKAIDGDIGINETLKYSITNVHPTQFSTAVTINAFNGVISLIRELDRESVPHMMVYIKATQQNNHLKSADSVVLITILDENDNPPQFSQSVYEASVPEHLPPGSEVLLLTASDKDEKALSDGYFKTNDTNFRVDNHGVMYLIAGELDREVTPQLFVKVWVFDGSAGLNSSALVNITVTDINDNNPEFQNQPLFFLVPEGNYSTPFLLGKVNVTDRDAGSNGETTLSSENEKNFIVHQNGSILVSGSLDRETKDRYVINLIASDRGIPPRKSFADLVIAVQDINDNAPTFTQPVYSVHLTLKSMKVGDPVLAVSARDLDIGNNSQISYRFAKPHLGFTINEKSGLISITSNLHAIGMESNISLIVIATDHGASTLSSTATVVVSIASGSTTFLNTSYSFSIFEGMPPGTEVGTVQAYGGPDQTVMYSLGTYTETFSITDKGTIRAHIILDREEEDSYQVMVKAANSDNPLSTGVLVVIVTVLDVNDNVPVFSPAIHTNLICRENEKFLDLGLIKATDKDNGYNGSVTYILKKDFGGIFHINSSTGQLSTHKSLDRETADSYELTVIARDSGRPGLSSSIIIHVSVQDVDDNPPLFEHSLYEVSVKENEAPHVIVNVSAIDKDTSDNALIMYSLTKVSQLFHLGEISGSLSNLQPLDFETNTQHVMTVIAYNPRDPHIQATATVMVHVKDVNEQGPRVENTVYHAVIWDGEYTAGRAILDINATQGTKAVDEGIHYSITSDSSKGLFVISNATGHIFIIKDLPPHHSPQHYTLTVNCRDKGIPPLSTSIMVFVVISPRKISYPVFSSDYFPATLDDWAAPHTVVTQIRAYYKPASLFYSFTSKTDEEYFIIDRFSGIIRTKKNLEMRDFPRNVIVKATDSQRSQIYSKTIVHVIVIHGNHWAPMFPKSLVNVSVKEDQKFPTLITQVQASDGDTGRNGVVQYSILNTDSHNFSIDARNGKIFALSSLDYENGPREFQIFVLAEDHGLPQRKQGYCTINVKVVDINDCKPVFVPINDVIIEENTPVGMFVGQVMATDQDSGDNAFIRYNLDDADDLFEIDGIKGKIFIKRNLDYETKQKKILNITATNSRTPPFFQTSTLLTVHILDQNDNAPQFNQKQYFAEVDVDSTVGTLVTVVNASDRDQGDNGIIEYFLSTDIPSKSFLIENVRDGRIITAGKLNPGEIIITAIAKDKGSPSLNSNTSVIVNVLHKQNTLPTFKPNELRTDLKKNENGSHPLYTFSAKSKPGNNITYRIVSGNEGGQFHLDKNTGELWTTKKFNYYAQSSYTVMVEAEDTTRNFQGQLPKNMARLEINLPDTNRGPIFEKQKYDATVLNSLPCGVPLIKVTAKDHGLKPKERLVYTLVNQSEEEFTVDAYTGQIKCKNLDGKTGIFHIKVQAMDPDGLFNQTTVQIKVEEAPSSHDDDVEMTVNQTLQEVGLHINQILRVLEKILRQKIIIVDLVPKNTNTIIFIQGVETNEELIRKLEDDMPNLQLQIDEIFHKPVHVALSLSQTSAMNSGTIAAITVFALAVIAAFGLIGFVFFKRYKRSAIPVDDKTGPAHTVDRYENGTQSSRDVENDRNVPPKTAEEIQMQNTTEDEQPTKNAKCEDIVAKSTTEDTTEVQTEVTIMQSEEEPPIATKSSVITSKIIPENISAERTMSEAGEHHPAATESEDIVAKTIPEDTTKVQTQVAITEPEEEPPAATKSEDIVVMIVPEEDTTEVQTEVTIMEPEEGPSTATKSKGIVAKSTPEEDTTEVQTEVTIMEPEEEPPTAYKSSKIPENITTKNEAERTMTEAGEHHPAATESTVPIPAKVTEGTQVETEEGHQITAPKSEDSVAKTIPEDTTKIQTEVTIMEPKEEPPTATKSEDIVAKVIPGEDTTEVQTEVTIMEPEEGSPSTTQSAVEPRNDKDTSEKKEQQGTKVIQETVVEYVESWESYESDEDSVTES